MIKYIKNARKRDIGWDVLSILLFVSMPFAIAYSLGVGIY
jgi:hypothetical protein